jgi:hypothetical protein
VYSKKKEQKMKLIVGEALQKLPQIKTTWSALSN